MLPGVVDHVIAAVQAAVPEYRGQLGENVRRGVHQGLAGFLELVGGGDEQRLPGREVYVSFGRGEARSGRTLEALLAAYRAGAQVAWRELAAAGDGTGLPPNTMYRLAEAIFAYVDDISAASAEGFAQQQSVADRELHERRRRLLEELLSGAPAAAVEPAAADARWELPRRLAVIAFVSADSERVARRLPEALVATLDDGNWALVPDPDAPGRRAELEDALRDARAGLGPTVGWREAAKSARRAALALSLADAGTLVRADDRLLDLLLAGDPVLAADLARRALAPLDQLPAGSRQRLRETLAAWLDAQGHARTAAESLHVHVQTLRYRLGRLHDVFGDSLDDPSRRLELALALRIEAQ
ncbi:MAG: helix-turn-helix domain-containing protein [Thermoleophilaceae bacterium]